MKYRSTLGGFTGLSFREAIFSTGFMSDGGLLLPESIPEISQETLQKWSKLNYVDLVRVISRLFISEDEIPTCDLNRLIGEALSTFTCPEILPVKRLQDGTVIMEMFHGRTWAFKDLALSCVAKLMEYFMLTNESQGSDSHVTIVVGTSGDTGSAVLEAVKDLNRIDCVVLLPRGRCTLVQERQMTSVVGDNIHIFRVDGTSDDLDKPIIDCFLDEDFSKKHCLTSVNSINWARVMVQIAHHFYAYFQVSEQIGDHHEKVEIVVPTGAMGNVSGGIIAIKMGLPVRFVTAVTVNDVVHHMVQTGEFIVNDDVQPTLATAMNISNPYNAQRVLSIISNGNVEMVTKFVQQLNTENKAYLPEKALYKLRECITSYRGSDDILKSTIKRCYHDNQYILCPHTALAVAYHYQQCDNAVSTTKRICLATASPLKFGEAVTSSGVPVPESDDVTRILQKPTCYEEMEKGQDWTRMLREKIESISMKYGVK